MGGVHRGKFACGVASWQIRKRVKRYITRFLKSIALFFLLFPVVYIILVAILFDIPLHSCATILLSPFYYIVSFCALTAGYGLWEMRRWSWHWFIAAQILVTYENAIFIVNYATSHHKILAYLLSLVLQVIVYFRVRQEVQVPYFFPRIRWWESNPRYRFSFPVTVAHKTNGGENSNSISLAGEVLDLSVAGCFVKLRNDLAEDEIVLLTAKLYGHDISCEGVIVWLSTSTVTSPKGIGVKFVNLNREQKRSFRLMVRNIKKISTLYRRYRYWDPDEFNRRLEEIEKNGVGGSGPKDGKNK